MSITTDPFGLSEQLTKNCLDDKKLLDDEVQTIYRLRTSYFARNNNSQLVMTRTLTKMKRLSYGFDILREDLNNIGATVMENITNINELADGLYEPVIDYSTATYDWETGYIDSYDLKLVQFKTKKNN